MPSTPKPTAALQARRWQELDLLCRLGLGLAPIAPDVCALLRQLAGADAAALFWLDEEGLPEGFFHEDSPDSVRDLFLNEFERLFVGPHETNVLALARRDGPRVGRLIAPDALYFRSNTYNLLLFRAPGTVFGPPQAEVLERASAHLARAFAPARAAPWNASTDGPVGHVLLDAASQRPVLADATAWQLLRQAQLRGLGLSDAADRPAHLPRLLAAQPGQASRIAVPQGVLQVQTHALHPPGGGAMQLLMTLQLQRPRHIDVARRVLALPLSPLQHEIALLAGLGHARADCGIHTGVGPEALKKHLRTILQSTHTSDWENLATTLRS